MKKFVVVGAYISEDGTDLRATFKGAFDTKEEAQEKLKELFKEAKDYGLDETMDSYVEDDYADIYYNNGSREVYEIEEVDIKN